MRLRFLCHMEYILGRKKGTSGLGNYEIASIAADTVVAVRGPDLLPGCSQRPEHSPYWSAALPTLATTNQELGCCAGEAGVTLSTRPVTLQLQISLGTCPR